MARWWLLAVQGPSMVPALHHGDVVLVQQPRSIVAGTVVVGRFRSMPEQLVVKRAAFPAEDGWMLASDNPFAGGDSAVHGVADVQGVVQLRWNRRLIWPRPVRRDDHRAGGG